MAEESVDHETAPIKDEPAYIYIKVESLDVEQNVSSEETDRTKIVPADGYEWPSEVRAAAGDASVVEDVRSPDAATVKQELDIGLTVLQPPDINFMPRPCKPEPADTALLTAYNHPMADKSDEPMDLTDLPLPSRSNAPVETQDAAASTSATPFAEPPTIAAPKSSAQRQREYRQRIAASRSPAQSTAKRISETERQRNYRLRKAANLAFASGSLESTTAFSSCSAGRSNDVQNSTQRQLTNQQRQSLAAEPAQTTVQPGTSSNQIEVPDEPMDITDLPLPSRSNAPVETQEAAASTSSTPFAEPPTIAAPKSCAQRQREYRQRIAASRTAAQSTTKRISDTERKRNYRLRKAANLALVSGSLESTTASSSCSAGRSNDVQNSTQRQLTNQQLHSLAAEPAQTTVQPDTSVIMAEESVDHETASIKDEPAYIYIKVEPLDVEQNVSSEETNRTKIVPADGYEWPSEVRAAAGDASVVENVRSPDAATVKQELDIGLTVLQPPDINFMPRPCKPEPVDTALLTAYNHPMADKPDEPMDLTDLPLPSRSNAPVKTQDAAASTSATPFAEPPKITAPKSSAQRQREYRQRIAASRTAAQSIAMRITDAERKRNYRLRKAANLAFASGSLESTTAFSSRSAGRSNDTQNSTQRQLTNQRQSLAAEPAQNTVQPGTSSDQIEVPDEPMDITDLPLPSRSNAPVETQDAAASTSATPFAEPPTITAPKSSAQRQREYRQRIAVSRTSSSDRIVVQQPQSTSSDRNLQSTWNTKWKSSILRFISTFLDNDFGYSCSVCDRLWFKNDLKPITAAQLKVISDWFIKENRQLCREEYELVCNTCKRSLNKKSMPPLAKVNGFSYPDRPPGLPPLDPISERLISPRLPFMQVRRLRHDFSYGIIGQAINVPVDVQEMIKCVPRQLDEDDVINVNIKRNLAYKSVYISEYMSKSTIKAWLDVLQKSPLYRLYEINVDLSRLNPTVPLLDDIQDNPSNRIENISAENTPESEILASRQHTMMWNEEDCLHIASGHQAKPLNNIIYERHAEELSFPSIYFGEPRRFNMDVSVTHSMMATSEIRRRDRRGATPQKILYVAMKILRLRMVDGIYNTFRNFSVTKDVTRRLLEDKEFLKEYVIQNLTFMKTVPNSVQYWASRKRDLFAMIRQLGKPTIFLTISANEIRWMKLLTILLKLSNKYPGKTAKDLNTSQRCTLVSDDPVTCCIYFYKLVGSLMKMLKSKQSYNPFGQYSVKDYFLCIEFQHCGSPHARILLWLNDDPHETVSENMPKTIELVEKLSSVARHDVPNDSIYANQIHKHTFTCTKRGETTCRFGIPYWPMSTTCVLVPMPQSDRRRKTLQQKAKELRTSLGEHRYTCMDDFLKANSLTYASYLDIVRSMLRRPTLLFRRNFDELMTNTFNPYLAGEVNSNIDIEFILDEYSCAEYVVEYVNKSARGMGNLRRELTAMMQEHPEQDYTGQLKALSIKLLNAVEMSAQEAAWYLLRQPMSETSCDVVYIPTVWPTERQRRRKRRQQMEREGIDGDSTNVWTKNIIQRYEERPASLEQVYLAEFASWYANANDFVDEEDDVPVDDDEDSVGVPEARTLRAPKEYRRRLTRRIIRYRRYNIDETVDYKREMVLLYVQFRNEISEIVDQNNFLQLFDDNKDTIMERRRLFETHLSIENVMKELEDNSNLQEEESRTAFVQRLLEEDGAENVDDVKPNRPKTRVLDCEEAKQCDVKAAVLRACTNHQSGTTGDHP